MGIRSFLTGKKRSRPGTPESRSLPSSPREIDCSSGRSLTSAKDAQIRELEHVFKKFDANGDGKISCSELGFIMESLENPCTEEELQKMMKEADADGDGFIDLGEFIEINTKGLNSDAVLEDLRHAFLVYDIDRNGSITAEELYRVMRRLGEETSMAECVKMINGVDSDGDGKFCYCLDEEYEILEGNLNSQEEEIN
ncbi:probable calcium-binding protein CML25 isoform X2 [Aristolochia californica]|uniref:probable calcium-binding protein CML25 isoform X2 n=1 Tax=Aristolochia californica TaxID=171875 RepID=UPI0035DAAF28